MKTIIHHMPLRTLRSSGALTQSPSLQTKVACTSEKSLVKKGLDSAPLSVR